LKIIFKGISFMITIFIALILFVLFLSTQNIFPARSNSEQEKNNIPTLTAYNLSNSSIVIGTNQNNDINDADNINRKNILNRAQAMVNVTWVSKYNLVDSVGHYIFLKGVKYKGIPYRLGGYQVSSANDFLSNINKSNKLYGNDCSGFVSIAWGVSRQTTLSLYNAVKNKNKIDGKSVVMISWAEVKPGDALLLEKGNGKGHILLFINFDVKNKDSVHVYEQNIGTIVPLEIIPVAREDIRSMKTLQKYGYIPIRLI
jgi:hypothetical protein